MARFRNTKGFTLVEMLVAMSIFVVFMGILLNSYSGIVRAQKEANDYRAMYTEARRVFDTLILEFRDGMVDYGSYGVGLSADDLGGSVDAINLISKGGDSRTVRFDKENGVVELGGVALNSSDVFVKEFVVKINPHFDPYSEDYVDDTVFQFHPSVTIYAKFEREKQFGDPYVVNFQTSISSRIYNQIDAQ